MGKPPKKPFKKGADNPGSRQRRKQTGAGRKKGTPNKITSAIKEHILNALNDLPGQLSGEGWLRDLARRDRRSMAGLLGKCIPTKVEPLVDPEETAAKIRARMRAMNEKTQPPPDEKGKK